MNPFEFTVTMQGERLDKILVAQLPDLSRSQLQSLIAEGKVLVNGQVGKAGVKLKGGEQVSVELPDAGEVAIEPQDIPLTILYEDADIVVIEKPTDLVVHPGIANEEGTLVNALLARYPQLVDMQDDPRAEGRMGIVHRLDKDTSGLMVIALNLFALENLMLQFKDRTVEKVYLALVERAPKTPHGMIEAPIGRDPKQRKRMAVRSDGKAAVTEFEVIDDAFREGRVMLKVHLHTGRTHQIRVHLAFIGCPIVGDRVYGFTRQRTNLKRNFLHASELAFDHPRTGERMSFSSDLPRGLKGVMEKLRED